MKTIMTTKKEKEDKTISELCEMMDAKFKISAKASQFIFNQTLDIEIKENLKTYSLGGMEKPNSSKALFVMRPIIQKHLKNYTSTGHPKNPLWNKAYGWLYFKNDQNKSNLLKLQTIFNEIEGKYHIIE